MVKRWKAEDAKENFDAVLQASETDGPQIVTKDGEEVAVLLSAEQWRRLYPEPEKPPKYRNLKEWLLAPEARTENLVAQRHRPTELESPQPPTYRNLKEWITAPEPRMDDFVAPRIRPTKGRPPPTFED